MARSFSFPRFTRQVQAETGVTNRAAGADMAVLANELEQFSARRQNQLDEVAAEEAFEQGTNADPGAAPDRSNATIRGRAFNRGVIVSHQAALQTDIRDSIGQFQLDHPNDPDAFEAKVEGLSNGLLQEADPALQPFIRERVADYSGRAKLRIIETQQAELRAEAAANLDRGAEGFLDDARTAAFEGDVPMVEARRQELTQLMGEGVTGELIDEGAAGELLATFERQVTGQEVLGNFNRHLQENPDDAGAGAIQRWQEHEPSDLGLTVDDHEAVTRQMITMRNRHASLLSDQAASSAAAGRAERKLRGDRVRDSISVLRSGFSPDPDQAEQVASDLAWLSSHGTPSEIVDAEQLEADFDVSLAIQGEVHRFRRMPSAARAEQLDELEAALRTGGASADQVQLLDALRKTSTEVDRQLEDDPRGYVNREGLADDDALDFSSADALASSIAARRETSEVGAQLIGQPLPLLTAAEADELAQVYQGAEIEERVGLLAVVTAGAGDDALATLEQLDAKGHERMALLGGYVLQGQGLLAREIMRGEALLASDSGIKPKRTDYQPDVDDTLGAALVEWPERRQQYLEAAFAKYAELKGRNGDLSDIYDPRLMRQALDAVVPTARFNGRSVAVPPGVTERTFDTWTDGWTAEDFVGVAGGDPERLLELARDRGRLVELGHGRYGLTVNSADSGNDKILVREDGTPFTLELPRAQ